MRHYSNFSWRLWGLGIGVEFAADGDIVLYYQIGPFEGHVYIPERQIRGLD